MYSNPYMFPFTSLMPS
ncbi:hypothetical protein Gotri_027401 [Gossypium trilobum]|uniref:Uncharacterized protein n=1 Tax=Gossypium trilobum TaxID=34281 RepID=A0A7J9FUU9_9ROSI|nr:hypothetical protein [Gossypium trilobum]